MTRLALVLMANMQHRPVMYLLSLCVSVSAGLMAIVVDESVGFSLGVIFVVFSGVWWLGRKLQNLEDGLQRAQEWRMEVKEHLDRNDEERRKLYEFVKKTKVQSDTDHFKK
jgi:hypothetical protein